MPYRIPHDRIAHETIVDEVVILDPVAGSYFSVTGAGAEVWALLARGVPPEAIGPALAPRYDAAPEVVGEAVHALVRELVAHDLLQETADASTSPAIPEAGEAPAPTTRAPWVAPRLERFDDLQALLVARSDPRRGCLGLAAQGDRDGMTSDRAAPAVAAMVERFARARAQAGGRDVDLRVAGHHVRLAFAGDALVDAVLPALAHLVDANAPPSAERPALAVHLWDTRSTGVDMIDAPWDTLALDPRGAIPGATAEGLYATYDMDHHMLVAVDPHAGVGVLWLDDAARYPRHDRAAPLKSTFATFFAPRGPVVTHAAAVGRAGRGVLLGGRGGSGKSTTSLLCLAAGLDFAGDDYVLVEVDDDAVAPGSPGPARPPRPPRPPMVHSLYATGKLAQRDTARVPALAAAFVERDDSELDARDKAIAFLHPHAGQRLTRSFTLAALLLPTVTGGAAATLTPMSPAHALRALAPSTVFQLDVPARPVLAALARLVARLPSYRLELGRDPAAVPEVIASLLAGSAA